jgi:signal transduction histidine kinase
VDLTHKLESIARMQGSGDDAVVQEVSLGSVAQEAARQLREMADARGVEIRIADSLPTVTVDPGRLELILLNLLSNAVKYSDPAKPIRTVDVTGTAEDDGCRIEVRDNGLGIPAEALATIFKRFTRAHADRHDLPRVTGIGLGLSIVEDSVRVLGGRIEVESVEAQGTTFLIHLPCSPSS